MKTIWFSLVLMVLVSLSANAGVSIQLGRPVGGSVITIQPGQSANIDGVQVYCVGGAAAAPSTADRCDKFHSDSGCQGAQIGSACMTSPFSDAEKGTCVRESNFGGKPNCKCR